MRASLAFLLVLAITCGLSSAASAGDGVVEINHARVAQGGITPSDTPGYPATIDRSGSYRLTGNLSPGADLDGVEIVGNDVTLDLNGFTIKGPTIVICPIGGCGPNRGVGVDASLPAAGVTVRNGTVTNMGGDGVVVSEAGRIDNMTARANGGSGLVALGGSIVRDSVARENQGFGIRSSAGSAVIGNTLNNNGSEGIFCSIFNGRTCGYGSNVLRGNKGSSAPADQVFGGDQIGINLCENSPCP